MPIPLSYNFRNLRERRVTSLMTALGTALAVAVLVSVLALVQGLRTAFAATGDPRDLLVLRKGSTAELVSTITRSNYQDIRQHAGIARCNEGPLASLEMVTIINISDENTGRDMNFNLRGVSNIAFAMRPGLHMILGRRFAAGKREVIVGKSVAARFPSVAEPGGVLQFGRGDWKIVGVFEAGNTMFNGEVWGDLNQVSADYNRSEYLSSLLIRTEPGMLEALGRSLEDDPRFTVSAEPEQAYYASQTSASIPVQFMGTLVALIMAVGSAFAAMNTMFAAVARRSAEIGILRMLGFTRGAILSSFLVESLVLAFVGAVSGCLLTLPLNNVNTDIGSYSTYSTLAFNFHVSLRVMAWGITFGLFIGALGGLLPALRASRLEIIAAIKRR